MTVQAAQQALFLSAKDFDAERISLFGALDDKQLNQLCAYLHVEQHKAGDTIFSQGEPPSSIYILLDGRVDCVFDHEDLHTLQASLTYGDVFGESAFIGIQPQSGTAKVTAAATLLVLDRDALMALHDKDLELFALLIMNMARELGRKYQKSLLE